MEFHPTNAASDTAGTVAKRIGKRFPKLPQSAQWNQPLQRLLPFRVTGRVCSLHGGVITAQGLPLPIGAITEIHRQGLEPLEGEVIGFEHQQTIIAPLDPLEGVRAGDHVSLKQSSRTVRIAEPLEGQVLDATGNPLEGHQVRATGCRVPCDAPALSPMSRVPIRTPLKTGVRCIDTMLTIGQGQRLGVFAAAGVGKSTLLGMLARGTQADHVVIGLIGERGREVREFLENDLGEQGRKKSTTVVATSDQTAAKRILAAKTATAIAESLRDQGKSVLLLMDSLTRFATAQREIGLAAGEAPTTRGYPTSVFSSISQLVERSGNGQRGSITAIYTVLVEGDDHNEPISDAVRSYVDGHITLSKSLANHGHFPAIDVLQSLSRLQEHLTTPEQHGLASELRKWIAIYEEHRELIQIGAYPHGSNRQIDQAIRMKPAIDEYLIQLRSQIVPPEEAWLLLEQLLHRESDEYRHTGR
jgi:flagellum-specific ATP synthase